MKVRCKFVCSSKREYRGWNGGSTNAPLFEYSFSAVTAKSGDATHENSSFFAATPSGTLNVSTVTDGRFNVGEEYYLDLSPAAEPAQ